ncbi:aminoacyl-histidine dipeptidase [Zobellia galactanivorans]|uniref:aminoacyl-histidine dipeptidase n=1 Tax=Zobellia galactanivorans (strain DSM 12802 / CCUG 47099 / CIP 106680 / NCIMB 13871 / Dsij) TaxID=63186 RepID=UPI0026E361F7|nr:aminoacyl-histidine dipeptidase [Zobellia galactanivorans]MDO6807461.1 aminoacyl-histidine dipeptidase [Zobellia galactanivorans]
MNEAIRELIPKSVWNKFADLNAVPRPSKKEERVIDFMINFGTSLNLETIKDEVGNVIIRKPASKGMEDRMTITLQSHLDMVHQKNNDTEFDFDRQGIEMFVDEDWVKAKGTTLGADNGMGVAAIMALLESTDIAHPPLEALFTIDEETGMTGAMGLKGGILQGKILLNLDTEEDDELDIGCAGGIDITATRQYSEKPVPRASVAYKITVNGLQGGHSGIEIHKGLGNANKIMNRVLYTVGNKYMLRISEIDGGSLRNAIPRESVSTIVLLKKQSEAFEATIEELAEIIKKELNAIEPNLNIAIEPTKLPKTVMGLGSQERLLQGIYAAHNGVYAMSATIPGLVETSNNVARVLVKDGEVKIGCLTRSSVDSAKMDLANALKSTFELAKCDVELSGTYPGWTPNPNSKILKVAENKYTALFNEKPKVAACHAGLECGILGQNYPDMDMISFGPTILGAHSPDERVSISSVQKFWKFLLSILEETPKA